MNAISINKTNVYAVRIQNEWIFFVKFQKHSQVLRRNKLMIYHVDVLSYGTFMFSIFCNEVTVDSAIFELNGASYAVYMF